MISEDLGMEQHDQIPGKLGEDRVGYIHRIELKMLSQTADRVI